MTVIQNNELYQKPVRKFKTLTFKQLEYFIMLMNDNPSKKMATSTVINMQKAAGFNLTHNIVSAGTAQFDRRVCAAFWGYLCFAREAGADFFAVDFPSHVGFALDDQICKVTAIEDKYKDRCLIALREAKKEDVTDVIVGINIDYKDVIQDMPKPPYVYLRMDVKNILTDVPKIIKEADVI